MKSRKELPLSMEEFRMQVEANKVKGKVIGLTGYATAGKDAVADILVEKFGYVKVGWSDKLCDIALEIDPIVWVGWIPRRLRSVVRQRGWIEAKRIPSVRKYLQWLGTDVMRAIIGDDVWVDAAMPTIKNHIRNGTNVVITNCRFDNEVDALESINGVLALVERPGVGPVNDHVSDAGNVFNRKTFTVENDGSKEDLYKWAEALHEAVSLEHPNPEANMAVFGKIIKRAIASGVKLVLGVAAPGSDASDEWMSRHQIECSVIDSGVKVTIDGQYAGQVKYSSNVLEVDSIIAR